GLAGAISSVLDKLKQSQLIKNYAKKLGYPR
uniref:Uperin-6.2 n=1 Tax=Uperoleia inundata TaxID=104953 RepID=UPE62_UPEIN|nr:RecName: Full=Uperin-6.2 [Uperoleia inundata]